MYREGAPIKGCKLNECTNHFFHKRCLQDQADSVGLKNDCYVIRCSVCSMQYGSMYGDMPEGKMFWSQSKKKDCEGYEGHGSYRIEYKVKGKDFSR